MTAQTITPGMPEPKEYGSFLIATSTGKPLFISHHRESESADVSWSDIEMDDCSWHALVRDECGDTIESMVTRDARIRREALTLSDGDVDAFSAAVYEHTGQWGSFMDCDLSIGLDAVAESRERESVNSEIQRKDSEKETK
ncbi:hypothetical protein [Bifidobacterium tibiigranuli]|uniref:Uncharacterized protein n=1 Tax=Bifidobacterium tibiigranuli TaxID=2172043 RepID=A0A5N6S0W9_9BIFI|nr:hypothetical protein [Bifidobacterium tibiigranuli]KAE8127311.1 hypothetical protein DDF78_08795 [Bifidobacterium tibiigranuli]KAE8129702.1 hypothetical protein DDE84_02575 [Bifidobacterium tibiigranuli]